MVLVLTDSSSYGDRTLYTKKIPNLADRLGNAFPNLSSPKKKVFSQLHDITIFIFAGNLGKS